MTTTSKLGADMTNPEMNTLVIQTAREVGLRVRVDSKMLNDNYTNVTGSFPSLVRFARALLARQPAAIDKQEAVAEVGFVVDCSQSIDDVLPADRRWTIANAISIVAEYRNCQASETKEVMQRFATYMRAALAEASKPAPSVEQDERGAFEAWCQAEGISPDKSVQTGVYSYPSARVAWRAWQARAASTSANVAQGWKSVPIEPTAAMVDALWDGLPKGFAFSNCTPTGVVASIIAAAPDQSANVARGAEAVETCKCKRLGDWKGFHYPLCDTAPPAQPALTDEMVDAARPLFLAMECGAKSIESIREYFAHSEPNVLDALPEWFRTGTGHLTKAGKAIVAWYAMHALTAAQSASGDTK